MRILNNAPELMMSSKLFQDYIRNSGELRDFYPSHFKDEPSWRRVMDEVSGQKRDYGELAEILRRQNSILGSGELVMEGIDKFASASRSDFVFAVVTGQQVGIFTGPLYTIYKAITAVELAKSLSERYDAMFIPVFWMEANDHDIEESNHINLLDREDELARIEYIPENYTQDCSMKDVLVDEGFWDVVLDLENRLPNTEFREHVFSIIRGAYLPSESIGQGFGRMMAQLMGKHGLVMLDPSDPAIKALMAPMIERNIEYPLKAMEMVASAGEKLRLNGYESQIEKSSDSTCLFIEEDGSRRKLFFQDGKFRIDKNTASLDRTELLSILRNDPWRFSPNVALRPVTQDYMLPTFAYVAGPGEISYFAQVGDLYEFLGVIMPVIYPRASFTIVESKIERIMERNSLDLQDLAENYDKLFSRLSKNIAAERLNHVLETSKSALNDIFDRLSSDLAAFDPDMKNVVESTKRKIDHQLSILEQRAYKAQRSRDEVLRNQIKRACMNIYPDGSPQERVFNIIQYLVLYGLQFLDDIMSALTVNL